MSTYALNASREDNGVSVCFGLVWVFGLWDWYPIFGL